MYKVIAYFQDLQDPIKTKSGALYTEYEENDIYPREGLEPSAERIAELLGSNNKQHRPLIVKVEDPEPVAEPEEKPKKKPAK